MWERRFFSHTLTLLLILQSVVVAPVFARGSKNATWKTLKGNPPLVIARGGFSGLFPDSSIDAYALAGLTSLKDLIVWCDMQLTKDGFGICFPNINLEKATNIADIVKNKKTNYFAADYTLKELSDVTLNQGVQSRTYRFDNTYPILTVEGLVKQVGIPGLWLNIQQNALYSQHNLSMRNFVLSFSRTTTVSYISSPEAGFLRSIGRNFNPKTTKLIFRFLDQNDIDPSSNQTYGTLLKNLEFVKTYASGILVPKRYIWPVDASLFLQPHTSLVADAHKVGLEVFASDFANDFIFSYNYSFDPIAEYLQFIDNGNFSVDGVLSDFPITPSEAIGCFAHIGANAPKKVNTLVISKYGASGDYPSCTDSAYEKAISDGVDVLDCPVQMSKDGTPFCLSSPDLKESTNVLQSSFVKLSTTIPEIKNDSGIFTFSLAWNDIQSLTPNISNPFPAYHMPRNSKYNKKVKFLTLSDFLNLTKSQTSLSGVMIIVENAAYLAEKQGFSVIDEIIGTLNKAGYDKPGSQKVMIQSTDSSVLQKFKEKANYELVYKIDEEVGDAIESAVKDIKGFADSVVVNKFSIFAKNNLFLTGETKIVSKLKSFNLSVYAETFSNEFVSQAWDFFSDATVEINTYVNEGKIDGIITDFPKTANRYRRNRCLNLDDKTPPYMQPVEVGSLIQQLTDKPPAMAPLPPLSESEVMEPALPPVSKIAPSSNPTEGTPKAQSPRNSQAKVTVGFSLCGLAMLVASILFFFE